jgi:hypothetical protein
MYPCVEVVGATLYRIEVVLLAELFALTMLKQGVTITDAFFDFGVLARTLFARFTERRRRTLRDSIH